MKYFMMFLLIIFASSLFPVYAQELEFGINDSVFVDEQVLVISGKALPVHELILRLHSSDKTIKIFEQITVNESGSFGYDFIWPKDSFHYPYGVYTLEIIDISQNGLSESIEVQFTSNKLEQDIIRNQFLTPPLKQFKDGVPIPEIKCKPDLQKMVKHDGSPLCVKPETKQKLIDRGWIEDNSDKNNLEKHSELSGSYELGEVLCLGGRGMILNERCERIGKYDIQTGIPIVENKTQCDLLNGTWYDVQNKCDSEYAPITYRFQFGYLFLGYEKPPVCTDEMMIHLATYSNMFVDKEERYSLEWIGLGENIDSDDFDACESELLKLR